MLFPKNDFKTWTRVNESIFWQFVINERTKVVDYQPYLFLVKKNNQYHEVCRNRKTIKTEGRNALKLLFLRKYQG